MLKSKLIRSQNSYLNFLKQYKFVANFNVGLSNKIEQLEDSANTSANDQLINKKWQIKSKANNSQEAYDSLLDKMEILSKYNYKLTIS